MSHKVTVYSNWERTTIQEFETLEEAYAFAEEMRHQQYKAVIDEIEEEEHWYNIHMTDEPTQYSIVFHTAEDFNKAREMTQILLPNDIDVQGIEMFWTEEWWRNQAVHELDQVGIKVDTYELL